jgi:hypothetical protein
VSRGQPIPELPDSSGDCTEQQACLAWPGLVWLEQRVASMEQQAHPAHRRLTLNLVHSSPHSQPLTHLTPCLLQGAAAALGWCAVWPHRNPGDHTLLRLPDAADTPATQGVCYRPGLVLCCANYFGGGGGTYCCLQGQSGTGPSAHCECGVLREQRAMYMSVCMCGGAAA